MVMKDRSFADVLTINAKDPAAYEPLPGEGASNIAVIIDIDPAGLTGVFAGHPCGYAEWNTNAWLIRPAEQMLGFTIYNREQDTFHFHNGVDLTWPITVGEVDPPAADDESADGETRTDAAGRTCDLSGRRLPPRTALPGSVTKTRGAEFLEKQQKEKEKEAERVKREQKSEREAAERKAGHGDSKKHGGHGGRGTKGDGGEDVNVTEDEVTKIR